MNCGLIFTSQNATIDISKMIQTRCFAAVSGTTPLSRSAKWLFSLTARNEHSQTPHAQTQTQTTQTQTQTLMLTIDTSSSMDSNGKMPVVLSCARELLRRFPAHWHVGLCTFDETAQVLVPVRSLSDASHKQTLNDAIQTLVPCGSSTNLCAAITLSMEHVGSPSSSSPSSSSLSPGPRNVLLFTDGIANEGVVVESDILKRIAEVQSKLQHDVSFYSFGFGRDVNSDLLTSIATRSLGNFYPIANTDAMISAVGDVFGNLMTTCVFNVQLQIHVDDAERRGEYVLHHHIDDDSDNNIVVHIGTMFNDESREFLLEGPLPKDDGANTVTVAATVSWSNFSCTACAQTISVPRLSSCADVNSITAIDVAVIKSKSVDVFRTAKNNRSSKPLDDFYTWLSGQSDATLAHPDIVALKQVLVDLKNVYKSMNLSAFDQLCSAAHAGMSTQRHESTRVAFQSMQHHNETTVHPFCMGRTPSAAHRQISEEFVSAVTQGVPPPPAKDLRDVDEMVCFRSMPPLPSPPPLVRH